MSSIKITLVAENGTEEEKTVSFAEGFPNIRPISGEDILATTSDVMALATGRVKSIKDLRFKKYASKPDLAASYDKEIPLSQEEAVALIADLAKRGSAMVKVN